MDEVDIDTEDEKKPSDQDKRFLNPTPMLDELEKGPWPSFITGIKELAERTKNRCSGA